MTTTDDTPDDITGVAPSDDHAPVPEDRAPVIGISGRRTPVGQPFALFGAVAIQEGYADAVHAAGGLAAILAPRELDDAAADRLVASIDGLVLTGGVDVDPALYGQEPHPTTYGVSTLQDAFETALLHAALRATVPVLAICRGLQLLNVVYGGTLHQHIAEVESFGAHGIPNGGGSTTNEIAVDPDSLLAAVTGTTTLYGDCHHHQAVDVVGEGLRVVATTADGGVEGMELADSIGQWLVAVQWHPEDTCAADPVQARIFEHLIGAAAR